MATPTPTCVWTITTALVRALDDRLGDPIDCYVNGSQTWLLENGPRQMTLEWRLHPVARYVRPPGIDTYDVFRAAVDGRLDARTLWDGLEVFPAHGDEATADELRAAVVGVLGIEPDACGLADHDAIGDEWERTGGAVSIVDRLIAQLR